MNTDGPRRQLVILTHQPEYVGDQGTPLDEQLGPETPELGGMFDMKNDEEEKEEKSGLYVVTATPSPWSSTSSLNNAESKEPYKKVPGTGDDSGHNFEVKMILLTFLRCLASGRDFRLATNLSGVGKFDDIVIEQDCEPHTILVQLKHKQKSITSSKFLAFDGKLSILTYFKSYRDDIRANLGDDCKLVFYTNVAIPGYLFQRRMDEEFLSTSEDGFSFHFTERDVHVYELPNNIDKYALFLKGLRKGTDEMTDENISEYVTNSIGKFTPFNAMIPFCQKLLFLQNYPTRESIKHLIVDVEKLGDMSLYYNFLDKFKVYCGQASESELDYVIGRELCRETGVCNKEELLPKLMERVRLWWKNKEAYYLSGDDQIWKSYIAELFRSIGENRWRKMNGDLQVKDDIVSHIRKQISSVRVLHIYVDGECTALTTCKVHQALQDLGGAPPIITSVRGALLERDSVLGAWNSRWGRVLVLEADKAGLDLGDMFSALADSLRNYPDKTLVVITNINDLETTNQVRTLRGEGYLEMRDETCLTDMTEDTQEHLVATEVNFQGHKVLLENLVGSQKDLRKAVNEVILMNILREEDITIGDNLQDPIDYYIPRTLRRNEVSFYESPRDISDRIVVVASKPGMGKSTLLTYLAKEIKRHDPCTWVIRANLSEHTSYLNSLIDYEVNSQSTIDFLRIVAKVDIRKSTCLEQYILNNCWQSTGRMVLLLDGYDEICPMYETVMKHIIKHLLHTCIKQLWITSRVMFGESLERIARSTSFTLDPFTKTDQQNFLKEVWKKRMNSIDNIVLNEFVDKVLQLMEFSLNDTENSFASVPLQSLFIAEMFEDNLRHFQKTKVNSLPFRLDILTLYEGFFRKKCEINLKEKRGYDITRKGVRDDFEMFIRDAENIHELCALVTLLPPCDIDKLHDNTVSAKVENFIACMQEDIDITGVIHYVKEGKPMFIHRTFAEYFMAKWFTKHYDQNRTFIKEFMERPNLYMVLEMMSRIQTRGFKLHTAVINHDREAFNRLLDVENVNLRDSGGRTALHLAAGFTKDEHFTRLLLERGADPSVVDALQWTALRYADVTQMWDAVGLLLQRRGNETDLVVTKENVRKVEYITPAVRTACERGYEAFLQVLFKNGVSVNMSLDEEQLTPLHIAAMFAETEIELVPDRDVASTPITRRERILDLMIKSGADVNAKTSTGKTVLHLLAETGNINAVRYMIERRTDETAEEMRSGTKRLFRVLKGLPDTLFHEKILTQARDINGKTAEEVTEQCGHEEVARYLRETHFSVDGFLRNGGSVDDAERLCIIRYLVEERGADIQWRDDDGKTSLHYAVQLGDMSVVEYIVAHTSDINCRDNNQDTPLHDAARNGNLNVVAWLIENTDCGRAALNMKNWTPLHNACAGGHIDVMKYLLKNGAFIDVCDVNGDSMLHVAVSCGNVDAVSLLVEEYGADLNARDVAGRTALHRACVDGHTDVVHYLVGKGARVDARDTAGNTVLHLSAHHGRLESVAFLIAQCRNNPNNQDSSGLTPLHRACIGGHLSVAKYLVMMGAKTSAVDENGDTPLHISAYHGQLAVVEFLVEACCRDPNEPRMDNMTALHRACMGGHINVVKFLIKKGAQTFVRDEDGDTPLHVSAGTGNLNLVEFLIEKCFNIPNKRNYVNRTPLHLACMNGHLHIVEYLLKKSDDVYIRDDNGDTVLHVSAYSGQLQVVKLLVERFGTSPNVTSHTNSTPLHKACLGGHLDVVQYLTKKGAKMSSRDKSGYTPLHLSASNGWLNVVKFLIGECKCDPNVPDEMSRTPLHVACVEDHLDVVRYLISEGAKVELSDKNSETPLHLAAYHGKMTVVEYLLRDYRIDPNAGGDGTWTPMHSACMGGNRPAVEYIVQMGGRPNCPDEDGDTPLHISAYMGNLNLVTFLVGACSVDPNTETCFTKTPLHRACIGGHVDVIRYLAENGSNIYFNMNSADSPIHVAAQSGKVEVVSYLIEGCGIDVNLRGDNNWTPLHSACFGGRLDVVKLLVKNGANVLHSDMYGDSPLHIATTCGKLDVVAFLTEKCGVDPNIKGGGSMTPLQNACNGGYLDVVRYLIEAHDVDTKCRDSRGRSVLDIARIHGESPSLVDYLVNRTKQCSTDSRLTIAAKILKIFHK